MKLLSTLKRKCKINLYGKNTENDKCIQKNKGKHQKRNKYSIDSSDPKTCWDIKYSKIEESYGASSKNPIIVPVYEPFDSTDFSLPKYLPRLDFIESEFSLETISEVSETREVLDDNLSIQVVNGVPHEIRVTTLITPIKDFTSYVPLDDKKGKCTVKKINGMYHEIRVNTSITSHGAIGKDELDSKVEEEEEEEECNESCCLSETGDSSGYEGDDSVSERKLPIVVANPKSKEEEEDCNECCRLMALESDNCSSSEDSVGERKLPIVVGGTLKKEHVPRIHQTKKNDPYYAILFDTYQKINNDPKEDDIFKMDDVENEVTTTENKDDKKFFSLNRPTEKRNSKVKRRVSE